MCRGAARKLRPLTRVFLRDAYRAYYGNIGGEELGFLDYDELRCPRCGLEFFQPMAPGQRCVLFVDREAAVLLSATPLGMGPCARTLEKLRAAGALPGTRLRHRAISPTPAGGAANQRPGPGHRAGIRGPRAKGWAGRVRCQRLESFLAEHAGGELFDFVASFHCLEHVPDPRGFVAAMLAALKPGGSLLLSTPYSPMSVENHWFDPLNHPPHHMSRWNDSAYPRTGAATWLANPL